MLLPDRKRHVDQVHFVLRFQHLHKSLFRAIGKHGELRWWIGTHLEHGILVLIGHWSDTHRYSPPHICKADEIWLNHRFSINHTAIIDIWALSIFGK